LRRWSKRHQQSEDWPDTGFLATYVATGAVLAVRAFVISVVSAPMIFDRGGSARRALMTSIKVVARNPRPMALWTALIATLAVIGLATLMAGLV
jgi:uncharacterized membrane protein